MKRNRGMKRARHFELERCRLIWLVVIFSILIVELLRNIIYVTMRGLSLLYLVSERMI